MCNYDPRLIKRTLGLVGYHLAEAESYLYGFSEVTPVTRPIKQELDRARQVMDKLKNDLTACRQADGIQTASTSDSHNAYHEGYADGYEDGYDASIRENKLNR
jgi:flagellar biosynthesis/type III secretory pathway protein FliH